MLNRNPEPHHGSNHHQMLTDGARAFFRQNMVAIKMLMHLSRSREDFKAKLRSEYLGHPLQLGW
jgi:hypothetical protein